MDGTEQAIAQLSNNDLIAVAVGLASLLVFIYAWVKRGEIATWEKKTQRLEARLKTSPPRPSHDEAQSPCMSYSSAAL